MPRLFRFLVILLIVAIPALTVAAIKYPPVLAYILVPAGRGPIVCDAGGTFQSLKRRLAQGEMQERAIANAPIIEERDGLQLARSPMGPFWEPQVQGTVVGPQLAEIEAKYSSVETLSVPAGSIVLDCGANVGTFTRYALNRGAARVVAIEPAERNLECLRRNFSEDIAKGRVIVYPKGVWDREDVLLLHEDHATSAMDSVVRGSDNSQGQRIAVTTIDNLVRELKLPRVDFIKMDIEGAERQAVDGARQTIRTWKPTLEISVNHLPDDPVVVPAKIRRLREDYQIHCLLCDLERWRIRSSILLFK